MAMIVSLYWLEPEQDSWIVSVKDASDDEMRPVLWQGFLEPLP
jgi:hypothetical protein